MVPLVLLVLKVFRVLQVLVQVVLDQRVLKVVKVFGISTGGSVESGDNLRITSQGGNCKLSSCISSTKFYSSGTRFWTSSRILQETSITNLQILFSEEQMKDFVNRCNKTGIATVTEGLVHDGQRFRKSG